MKTDRKAAKKTAAEGGGRVVGGVCDSVNWRKEEAKRRPHRQNIGVLAPRSCDLRYTPHSQRVPDSTRLAETLFASPTRLLGTVLAGPRFFQATRRQPAYRRGGGSADQGIAGLSHSAAVTGGLVPTIRVTTIGKSIGGYGGN